MLGDERRSIRYPVGMKCVYRLHNTVTEPVSAMITNVSRQGCGLETEVPLGEARDVVEIHFSTPEGGPSGLIVGEVVQRKKNSMGWALGVAFLNVDPDVKWTLLSTAYRRWEEGLTTGGVASGHETP